MMQKNRRGSAIIEVLVSSCILVSVGILFLECSSSMRAYSNTTETKIHAVSLTRQLKKAYKAYKAIPGERHGVFPNGQRYLLTVNEDTSTFAPLEKAEFSVSWDDIHRKVSMNLNDNAIRIR